MTPEQHLTRARAITEELPTVRARLAAERREHLRAARAAGWKWDDIAAWVGLHPVRVRQLVARKGRT